MNKLLLSTLSAGALAMAASSMAQPAMGSGDQKGHDQNKPAAAAHQAGHARPNTSAAHPARMAPNTMGRTNTMGRARTATPETRQATTQATRPGFPAENARNPVAQTTNRGARQGNRGVTPTTRARTTNLSRYRGNVQATRRYRNTRAYVRPSGWYARRWTYGQTFPRGWYGQQYWITNFLAYGLISPPYGYEWVRSGDDALLIDLSTGMIVRVEYGLFY